MNPANLRDLLEKSKQQIALALPKHLTAERMIRVAMTAYQRNPALQDCSPISIVACVVQASELGLELVGPLGHAYMVPYKNKHTNQLEAQFQVGYRGFLDLAYRSGKVETFCAHCVRQNDFFCYQLGTRPSIEHRPTLDDPGPVIAVYAVVRQKGGGMDCDVMSTRDVEAHRAKYSKQKGDYSPWATAWEEMAKKTVIRRLAKRVPLSVELVQAAVLDEYGEAGVQELPQIALAMPTTTTTTTEKVGAELAARARPNGATADTGDLAESAPQTQSARVAREEDF